MEDIRTEHLSKVLEACEELLEGYRSGDGLEKCPLCSACHTHCPCGCNLRVSDCDICPHVFIERRLAGFGSPCYRAHEFILCYVREHPREYPKETKQRIAEILKWISLISAEIERRNNVQNKVHYKYG